MAYVSRKRLAKKVSGDIQARLLKTVTGSRVKTSGANLLEELLTRTEREMLAKRLSALFLLTQGLSAYRVHKMLHMSPTTMRRMQIGLERGKYPHIISFVQKRKEREEFWNWIETLARMGMPERGRNRWKWLDDLYPR